MLAISGAKFLFHGVAAHAAIAPERGRSALDAVMLMGNGIEFMREHVPSTTRVHYIITNGGAAPNVVPDTAELHVVARSPYADVLKGIWERIAKISQGAALMTETSVEIRAINGDANVLPNDALAAVGQRNVEEAGGYILNDQEKQFALELQKALPAGSAGDLSSTAKVQPLRAFRSEQADGIHRRWGRQLECTHDRIRDGDLRSRSCAAYLAGCGVCRDEHRAEGHGGRSKGTRDDWRRFVF
jgi:aminobenzoyl-glutamate utilization protein B